MDEHGLITRVLANRDQHAFATLVKAHQSDIRHFLRRLTVGDHAGADDLAQETFFKAYQKLATFRAESSFKTWLHSIAYRLFLKYKDKAYHEREQGHFELDWFAAAPQSAEQDILVERLMSRLTVDERTCVSLAYSAGMSHKEIVEVTGLPLGTVKSHILRGKQKLVEQLASNEPAEEKHHAVG